MPINSSVRGSFGVQGRFGGRLVIPPISSVPGGSGQVILNGYGFEAWPSSWGNGDFSQHTFTVPALVTKLRCIAIGGGGGSGGAYNVIGAAGGSGVEFFTTVTPGEVITIRIGRGGIGSDGGDGGTGGNSAIFDGAGTLLAQANGGINNSSFNVRPSYSISGLAKVTAISVANGGVGLTNDGSTPSSALNPIPTVYLAGATAHAGGGGAWYSPHTTGGNGIGFGGGGGRAGDSSDTFRSGGVYGYRGGWAYSSTSVRGGGPAGGYANQANSSTSSSGGGGGSFGGGGVDGWAGGWGAGGLIRIWWASSTGVASWIDAGGNYI